MILKTHPVDHVDEVSQPSEFVRIYDNCRNSLQKEKSDDSDNLTIGKVQLKLARLNTVHLESASFTCLEGAIHHLRSQNFQHLHEKCPRRHVFSTSGQHRY